MLPLLLLVLAAQPAASPAPSARSQALDPVYVNFTTDLERGIFTGDASVMDTRVDLERLIERSTRNTSTPKAFADAFGQGIRGTGIKLGQQLIDAWDEDSDFHLLRLRMEGGTPRALFRVVTRAGLNYLDLELGRDAKGEAVIVDIYPYIAGEFLSETIRRTYLIAATEAGHGLMDKLLGKEQEFIKNLPKLQAMQRLTQEKQYAEVVKTFGELPASLRQNKSFLLIRLGAASNLGGDEYQKAITEFAKAHPSDPSLDLIAIDGHMLRKDYSAVLKTIDRLDQRVKDPYLKYLRGSVLLEKGDAKEARRHFQAAIDAEPGLTMPYWVLIGLGLQESHYKDVARYLTAIERDAGVELGDLEAIEQYSGFVKSPEGKAWLKPRKREARAAPAVP